MTGQYVDPRAGAMSWDTRVTSWMDLQTWAAGTREAAETAVQSVPWRDDAIKAVRPSVVQSWVSAETKRGLAPSTIRTRLNYVQMAFRAAVLDKVIPEHPAATIEPPRARKAEAAMRVLTAEQVHSALEHAGDFYAFVAVCALASLRLGEAAGLQLQDVDLLRRNLTVARQVQGATNKTAELVPPKFGSERTIHVPDDLMTILSAHVAEEGVTLNVYSHLWPSAEDKTRTATAAFMSEVLTPADSLRTKTKKSQVSGPPQR